MGPTAHTARVDGGGDAVEGEVGQAVEVLHVHQQRVGRRRGKKHRAGHARRAGKLSQAGAANVGDSVLFDMENLPMRSKCARAFRRAISRQTHKPCQKTQDAPVLPRGSCRPKW
jgi:hypothetical protein